MAQSYSERMLPFDRPNLDGAVPGRCDHLGSIRIKTGLENAFVFAKRLAEWQSRADVPKPRRIIHGGRHNGLSVRTESPKDNVPVVLQLVQELPVRHRPE